MENTYKVLFLTLIAFFNIENGKTLSLSEAADQ